jgi:hypothetical protein
MTDDDDRVRNAILYSLGLVDVERALVEALADVGALDIAAVASRSPALETEVERTAKSRPFTVDVHSQLFIPCGTLSVLSGLCAVLIGQGVLDAEDLLAVLKQRSEDWRSLGSEYRALPAEILRDALVVMAAEKRDVDQRIASSRNALRSGRAQ